MRRAQILLLGDSISLGYRELVKNRLRPYCKVMYPVEQGKFAADIYRMLYEWSNNISCNDVDVVYWNAGLWDVVRIFGEEPQTSIDVYCQYLVRTSLRLRKIFPNAKICFASTTPVIENRYDNRFHRLNSDIDRYNLEADNCLRNGNIIDYYDDLYSIVAGFDENSYIDATHLDHNANRILSEHICTTIERILGDYKEKYTNRVKNYKREEILSQLSKKQYKGKMCLWGASNNARKYAGFIGKYIDINCIIDKDYLLEGATICGLKCKLPENIPAEIEAVIAMVDNIDSIDDIGEYCEDRDIVCFEYKDILSVIWRVYEEEYLANIHLTDSDANKPLPMVKYIGLSVVENKCNLDCSYCYLSVDPNRRIQNIGMNNPHNPKFIRERISMERMGGACLIGITGSGETLLADGIIDICLELLREGHYLHIVTNGIIYNRIKELIELSGDYAKHIIFKLSFHYLQLKNKNLLDTFSNTVKTIDQSNASYTIELMPHDEIIDLIPEILEYSQKEFGAYPHITIGRDERNARKLLSKKSYEEFVNIWSIFDSKLFDLKTKLYMHKGKKCQAGNKSVYINLYTGEAYHCLYYEDIGNIYISDIRDMDLEAVGDKCQLNYCYNCHIYAALGVLPISDVPSYFEVRDRKKLDGKHWIKEEMRNFLDVKL